MDPAMTECLKWDKPLTSQQAARYHLTRGFVPVELHDAKIRQLAARVKELGDELVDRQQEVDMAVNTMQEAVKLVELKSARITELETFLKATGWGPEDE